MAAARRSHTPQAAKLRLAALVLLLGALPAQADSFQQMWMGRIARPPADNQEASVYWEDTWDARGKRFKPNEISCAIGPRHSAPSLSSPISKTAKDKMSGAGSRPVRPWQGSGFLASGSPRDRLRRPVPRHRAPRRLRLGSPVARIRSPALSASEIRARRSVLICPPMGKSPPLVQPPSKNISVFQKPNQVYMISHPVPIRGALAIVTNVGAGCGGREQRRKTSGAHADGEGVWS